MFLEHDEMKFAILYTLEKNIEPISMPALCDILTWEKQVMNYFDLALMLNELIDDGFVDSKYYRDERSFLLNEKGKETNMFFFERVPKSIRNRIDKAIAEIKFEEQANPNAIITEVIPVAPHQYMASMNMLDANLPLLELKIYAGSRADAEQATKLLKEQAEDIYKIINEKVIK
ncbi:MAG: DUF4364 family protein [Clostridia bacterium]|nr:DUF4364 family protein [Clostridia bacterium]